MFLVFSLGAPSSGAKTPFLHLDPGGESRCHAEEKVNGTNYQAEKWGEKEGFCFVESIDMVVAVEAND